MKHFNTPRPQSGPRPSNKRPVRLSFLARGSDGTFCPAAKAREIRIATSFLRDLNTFLHRPHDTNIFKWSIFFALYPINSATNLKLPRALETVSLKGLFLSLGFRSKSTVCPDASCYLQCFSASPDVVR